MMSKELTTVSLPAANSVSAYLAWANSIPMLTAEEEHELALRLRDHNDVDAARKLILPHIRYVARIARDFLGYGLNFADLVQEGSIGLMKAVKRFNPDLGVRLASYAAHWIKSEIYEFIIKNWRIVKIATTKAQRKLFFNLRKQSKQKRLGWHTEQEIAAVAKDLDVTPADVRTMEMRMNHFDEAFDAPADTPEDSHWAPAHYLEHKGADPAHQVITQDLATQQKRRLQLALNELDERSRDIIQKRWLDEGKATLQELSEKHNISLERVRQIEKAILQKLKHAMSV